MSRREWCLLAAALVAGFGGGVLGGNVTTGSSTSSHVRFASSSGGGGGGRVPTEGSTAGGEKSCEKLKETGKLTTCYGWESLENAAWQPENDAFGYRSLSKVGTSLAFTATTEVGTHLKSISVNTALFQTETESGGHPRVNCGTKIPANDSVAAINSSTEVELHEAGTEAASGVACTIENPSAENTATGAWAGSALKGGSRDTFDGHETAHNSINLDKSVLDGYRAGPSLGPTGGRATEDTCIGTETCSGYTTSSGVLDLGFGVHPGGASENNRFALGRSANLLLKGKTEEGAGLILEVLPSSEGHLGFFGSAPVAKPAVTGNHSTETAATLLHLIEKLAEEGLVTNSTT